MFGLENLTFPRVWPLGAILFEFLFLLVAIPLEAYILNRRLKFDKKTSMFYAISINLFSSTIGWIIFFIVEPMLPINLKSELINYILFNNLRREGSQAILILTVFIIFFITFLMKFILLKTSVIALRENFVINEDKTLVPNRLRWRRASMARLQNSNLITTVLIANSLSYSAITIVLLLGRKTI